MKTIYKVLIIASITFACLTLINRCDYKKAEVVNTNTALSDLRRFLTDSIQTADNITLVACIEDVKQKEAIKSAKYRAASTQYRNYARNQKHISDSLQELIPKSDTTCIKTIASKQIEIDDLNTACDSIEAEAESYSKRLFLCESQKKLVDDNWNLAKTDLSIANKSIERLMQSNKSSWLDRNKLWIGFIAGATGVYLLTK